MAAPSLGITQVDRPAGLAATATLLAMAATWGSALTIVKDVTERLPILDFMAVRCLIAGAVLLAVAPRAVGRLSSASRWRAVGLGLVWGGAQLLQVAGLSHTGASVSGFISGLFVVATPLLARLLLRQRLAPRMRLAVALATVGLAVVGLKGFSLGLGELLTAIAAVLYGLHILGLSAWARPGEVLGMSTLQMLVAGFLYFAAAGPTRITAPGTTTDWLLLLYLAIGIAAGGLLAQTWAQARLSPTRAALVLSTEPVFAAGFAIAFGGEPLTVRLVVGGSLLMGAVLVTELRTAKAIQAEEEIIDLCPSPPGRQVGA